jgi:hypothetical protein
MSKKQDFLRDEQSRQKHPEKHQVGSSADAAASGGEASSAADRQQPHTGKVANDHTSRQRLRR